MDLSVIIVNYNVSAFLDQCLQSVRQAMKNFSVEVFVVDNNSVDGSVPMIRDRFPWVELIENKTNVGFSKANNQAIRRANGRYILLLNPDTVIEENTLDLCYRFMEEHPDAGSLGVKMVDGRGRFLPESKRALPTPWVAFSKIFGLSKLFPRSRFFSRYHLGYLDKEKTHRVEVLSGAFMFIRREVLDKTGIMDEDFFMYGEDIDLSYRILKAGYHNYYYPEPNIIHYKGESTKKGSLNYVLTFYNAMIIFANKHFSPKMAQGYAVLIRMAIYFRAFLSISKRFALRILLPLADFLVAYLVFLVMTPVWENYKFGSTDIYPPEYLHIVVPLYLLVWLLAIWFAGGYDKPLSLRKLIRGILAGAFILLVIYALLPETLRYSRALILIGTAGSIVLLPLQRLLLGKTGMADFELRTNQKKRTVIVGILEEARRVENLLNQSGTQLQILGYVHPQSEPRQGFLGGWDQLEEIVNVHKIKEIIFCSRNKSAQEIIRKMIGLSQVSIDYKIAPPESFSVIGSNSIDTAGDIYLIDVNSITQQANIRNKRLFDLLTALLLILFYPLTFYLFNKPGRAFLNMLLVLAGKYSWVGYHPETATYNGPLPRIRKGILTPVDQFRRNSLSTDAINRINILYAKDYDIMTDFRILFRGIRKLGRKPISKGAGRNVNNKNSLWPG